MSEVSEQMDIKECEGETRGYAPCSVLRQTPHHRSDVRVERSTRDGVGVGVGVGVRVRSPQPAGDGPGSRDNHKTRA